jgi:hypothetical protein
MRILLVGCFILTCHFVCAQGTFTSANSGSWTDPDSWTLVGTDSDGNNYPDGNDNVIINGHTITVSSTEATSTLELATGIVEFSGAAAQLNVRGTLSSSGASEVTGTSTNHRLVIVNNGTTVLGNISVNGGTFTLDGARLTNNGELTVADGATFLIDDSTAPTVVANHLFTDIDINSNGTFQNNDAIQIIIRGTITNNGTFNGCGDDSCNYTYNVAGSFVVDGTTTVNMPRVLVYNGATLTNQGLISTIDLLGNGVGVNTFVNEGTLTVNTSGTIDEADLVLDFDAVGNTLVYEGSTTEQLFSSTFYNVEVNLEDGTLINLNNGVSPTINNNLTVTSGDARIINSANTLTVLGNLSIEGDGSFFMNTTSAGEGISITGDFDVSSTNATAVDLNNGTITFTNMTITNGADVFTGVADLTSTGTITVTNGSVNPDGTATPTFNNILVEANGSWLSTSVYDPTITGNITNNGTFTACLNTSGCDYILTSGSGTLGGSSTISNMANIFLNDGASYTNENTSVGGIQVGTGIQTTSGAGSFINGANATLDYSGTLANFSVTNFTASAAGNTVIFSRPDANQSLRATTDVNNEYVNVTINKADGFDVILDDNITVSGTLTLTAGDVQLNAFDLTLADGATVSGGNSTSYIKLNGAGLLNQEYSAVGATLSFPIGDVDDFSPINSLTLHSATLGASPSIEFDITDAANSNRDVDNTGAGGDDDGTAATSFLSRFWTLTPTDISDVTFSASYTYVDTDVAGATANEAELVGSVYRTPIGEAFLDWSVEEAVNATSNLVTVSNVSSSALGVLYAMDNTLERLPVELLSFTANTRLQEVVLNWETTSEENNSHFTIERSANGISFQSIGELEGKGNSSELISYSFIDEFPLTGRAYYRLKQVDFSGAFEYSEVISAVWDGAVNYKFRLFPNPVNNGGELTLSFERTQTNSEVVKWQLLSITGEQLIEQVGSDKEYIIETSKLSVGTYLVRVVYSDGRVESQRLNVN